MVDQFLILATAAKVEAMAVRAVEVRAMDVEADLMEVAVDSVEVAEEALVPQPPQLSLRVRRLIG